MGVEDIDSGKMLEKIQKLLKLSKSTNEHEAALAASRVQELLDKYHLTMEQVEARARPKDDILYHKGDGEKRARTSKDAPTTRRYLYPYVEALFSSLARQFDCFPVIFHSTYRGKTGGWEDLKELRVIGHKSDVEVFQYTFNYLLTSIHSIYRQALREKKEDMGRKLKWGEREKFRKSFCSGAADRVCRMVREERAARLSKDQACTALVHVRKKKVKEWVDENLVLGKPKERNETVDKGMYMEGWIRGGEIPLRNGIQGQAPTNSRRRIQK